MEEAQYKFYRLRDEATYYIAASQPARSVGLIEDSANV